jgi:polysaccharide export outer membrane protein
MRLPKPADITGGFLPPFFLLAALFLAMALVAPCQAAPDDSQPSSDYRLGVGDRIRIQVHDEDDLTVDARIEEKGIVSFPFLGEIRVLGLTLSELERQITIGLKDGYLLKPEVRVMVVEYRKFYVIGEVKAPGGYPYIPGLTVRKAATLAGGFTERASSKKIYVLRENSKQERTKIELDGPVYPGDTVIVDEGLF